jgi:adenylosuccinate synthase
VEPVYETLPGWNSPTSHIRSHDDLPQAARDYVRRIEAFVRCPIGLISVGPDREQTILRDNRLED